MEAQDTEITLGTGKMLGFFFGLAVLCAIFFGMGFTLGRNTAKPDPNIQPANAPLSVTTPALKPAAAKAGAPACAEGQNCEKSTSDELSFAKPEEKAQPVAQEPAAESTPDPSPETAPARSVAASAKPAPEMKTAATPSAYVVQIAAVTKKDDADALVGALRKKNYPVFISADANDHLYHVQVGPYADRKDAGTMKDKLAGDGYNAIVK